MGKSNFIKVVVFLIILTVATEAVATQVLTVVSDSLVTIDVGKRDGVRPGMLGYVIYRQEVSGRFVKMRIAKLKVVSVKLNTCSATVLQCTESYTLSQGMKVVFVNKKLHKPNKRDGIKKKPAIRSIVDHLKLAQNFLKAGKLERAKSEFEAVLKVVPGDLAASEGLRVVNQRIRERDAKKQVNRQRLEKLPNYDYLLEAGKLSLSAGQFEVAVKYFDQILKIFPDDKDVLNLKLTCLEKQEKWSEFAECGHRLALLLPGKSQMKRERLIRVRDSYVRAGDFSRAISTCNELISENPGDDSMVLDKVEVLIAANHLSVARRVLMSMFDKQSVSDRVRMLWRRLLPKEVVNDIGMKLVLVHAGTFDMGVNSGYQDSQPKHRVIISKDFYLGMTEVTQKEWLKVMRFNPSTTKTPSMPVHNVTWEQAQLFLRRLSVQTGHHYRLPTEAEWEFACKAGSTQPCFYGSDTNKLFDYAWYSGNSEKKLHRVALKSPNAWGLYDMLGNVWEWCQDWYAKNYYSNLITKDPGGPVSGVERVCRGGSWANGAGHCSCVFRAKMGPSKKSKLLGVRVVLEIEDLSWPE